jgi:signal transduction histidine kinase
MWGIFWLNVVGTSVLVHGSGEQPINPLARGSTHLIGCICPHSRFAPWLKLRPPCVAAVFAQGLWIMFAVTWDLAMLDLITPTTEESLYLICDFSAKVLFSSTLMLSSFKGIEARRETAMRQIEESSKQKLIEELRHLLEQKERFMSSVSHELRTPLNGIIGISEGMLSGCCGVLPEAVRAAAQGAAQHVYQPAVPPAVGPPA